MEFHCLSILTFLSLAVVGSHAVIQPVEIYWDQKLPNTPMPIVIKNLLKSAWLKRDTSDACKGKEGAYVSTRNPNKKTDIVVSKEGILASMSHDETPFFVGPEWSEAWWGMAWNKQQPLPNTLIFFLRTHIRKGKSMSLDFHKTANEEVPILPRQVANSIPFSSNKFLEILDHFLVEPGSKKAKIMKHTVQLCEDPLTSGEPQICATSLESMIDFTISQLGEKFQAMTTEVEKETQKQIYIVTDEAKLVVRDNLVVCHKLSYVYAIFYCHSPRKAEVYSVSLLGADGNIVDAVAICHKNTSSWNPKHLAFQLLKVKPGAMPICHFVLHDNIILAPY